MIVKITTEIIEQNLMLIKFYIINDINSSNFSLPKLCFINKFIFSECIIPTNNKKFDLVNVNDGAIIDVLSSFDKKAWAKSFRTHRSFISFF